MGDHEKLGEGGQKGAPRSTPVTRPSHLTCTFYDRKNKKISRALYYKSSVALVPKMPYKYTLKQLF